MVHRSASTVACALYRSTRDHGPPPAYALRRFGAAGPAYALRASARQAGWVLRFGAAGPRCYSRVVRVVGIDLGERRIGVAVSDASGTLARPLRTIERGTSDEDAAEQLRTLIAELAAEDEVGSVVVGLPTRLDGSPNRQTRRVGAMLSLLSARLTVPVLTYDERLSSREAEERLSLREKDWRKRKARLDAAAAAVILQDYLDARSVREQRAEGRGQTDSEGDTE